MLAVTLGNNGSQRESPVSTAGVNEGVCLRDMENKGEEFQFIYFFLPEVPCD